MKNENRIHKAVIKQLQQQGLPENLIRGIASTQRIDLFKYDKWQIKSAIKEIDCLDCKEHHFYVPLEKADAHIKASRYDVIHLLDEAASSRQGVLSLKSWDILRWLDFCGFT